MRKLWTVLALASLTAAAYGGTINYEGKDYWINGINVPWHNWGCDVGSMPGDWGGYTPAWFEDFFTQCQASGVNCVRLWLHCEGWATPEFNASGYVTGLSPTFIPDLQDILARAANHGVMVMPCLWSFDMTDNSNGIGLIATAAKTQSYIDQALVPLVTAFADTPNLFAWEIINEPEWSIEDGHVTRAAMQRFVGMLAAAIHQHSGKMVTTGSAALKWNSDVWPAVGNWWSDAALQAQFASADAHLDFYQVHYYDWCQPWDYDPFDLTLPVSRWQLDKPVLVGECPASDTGSYTMQQQLDNSWANGYVGIMFWSYNSDYGANWPTTRQRLKAFRDLHPRIVDYLGSNYPPTIDSAAWAAVNPVTLPAGTTVHVEASDADSDPLTYAWSQVSGAGTATFAAPAAADSGVSFSVAGSYVLRVTVNDGRGGTATSDVTVTVNAGSGVDARADVNHDSVVNALDLQIVIASFGQTVGSPGCDARADANADSVVNALDLQIIIANFGQTVP